MNERLTRFASRGRLIALAIIVVAVIVALLSASWVGRHPSSSDASLDADVVHVAAAVGGRILETQARFFSPQRSNAAIAADQTMNAKANYELAIRTADRLRPLTAKGYVPNQQLDQADVSAHDAATHLQQAQVQQLAAVEAIDTVQAGESAVAARRAALAL